MDKKKVFIYLPMNLPIPAVGGGAIETLITNLIEENELQQLVELIIISKNDEKAKRKNITTQRFTTLKMRFITARFKLFIKLNGSYIESGLSFFKTEFQKSILKPTTHI